MNIILLWVFAIIGMLTCLVGVVFLLGAIFSGGGSGCVGSSGGPRWMEEMMDKNGWYFTN